MVTTLCETRLYPYCFLYHGDQKISWWRVCRWRAVNFEIHLWSSGMDFDLGECFFGVCASRWSHQLTSDPKRRLLFWKCLQLSSLKAVSVPTFVIGSLQGSTTTSGPCTQVQPATGQALHNGQEFQRWAQQMASQKTSIESLRQWIGHLMWIHFLPIFWIGFDLIIQKLVLSPKGAFHNRPHTE